MSDGNRTRQDKAGQTKCATCRGTPEKDGTSLLSDMLTEMARRNQPMQTAESFIKEQLIEAQSLLERFIGDDNQLALIEKAAQQLALSFKAGGKVMACGNGGSHCDAMHFAEELTGRYRENRPGYPAIAISDPSHISCVANDFGYEHIFSRYIEAVGHAGDWLLAISTSGNSSNIVKAVQSARDKGIGTLLLTGKDGGKMAGMADIAIHVSHEGYADRIQEIHIKIIHILIGRIEQLMEDSD